MTDKNQFFIKFSSSILLSLPSCISYKHTFDLLSFALIHFQQPTHWILPTYCIFSEAMESKKSTCSFLTSSEPFRKLTNHVFQFSPLLTTASLFFSLLKFNFPGAKHVRAKCKKCVAAAARAQGATTKPIARPGRAQGHDSPRNHSTCRAALAAHTHSRIRSDEKIEAHFPDPQEHRATS